jgi:phosphoesterase RecJ-like protein
MVKAWQVIKESRSILLATHIDPDGDTISSALSIYPLLKDMGKKVTLLNIQKELPIKYDFLPNFKKFRSKLPSFYDLVITFDSADITRLGFDFNAKIINIDHHKSNTNYGDINIIDETKISCTMVVYDLLKANKISLRRDVATCLYTGLVSDSDFFKYRGVDENTFVTASHLVKAGADPTTIATSLQRRDSLAKMRLTSIFINNIKLKENGTIGVGIVTTDDLKCSGATVSDSDHLVNMLISLSTVKLAIFAREELDETYKFSLRSKGSIDVSIIARSYGGGGHKFEAGFGSKLDVIDDIIKKVDIGDV